MGCTKRSYDGDVGYHVVKPSNEDDWTYWNRFYEERGEEASWDDLQISLCGVFPQSANSGRVPKTRNQCNKFQDNFKPSIVDSGRFCVCVKPSDDDTTFYDISGDQLASFQMEYE